jgi:hypothetical protein
LLRVGDTVATLPGGGYGIEVQGERYFFVFDERSTFSLLSADGSASVAHIKVDRSPSKFSEQSQWRERWLADIAERSGVPLIRRTPSGKLKLLTVNKKALAGKSAGLSVLADSEHKVFVQWEWDNSATYTGPEDVAAIQAATWKKLIPCLAKRRRRWGCFGTGFHKVSQIRRHESTHLGGYSVTQGRRTGLSNRCAVNFADMQ